MVLVLLCITIFSEVTTVHNNIWWITVHNNFQIPPSSYPNPRPSLSPSNSCSQLPIQIQHWSVSIVNLLPGPSHPPRVKKEPPSMCSTMFSGWTFFINSHLPLPSNSLESLRYWMWCLSPSHRLIRWHSEMEREIKFKTFQPVSNHVSSSSNTTFNTSSKGWKEDWWSTIGTI